MRNIYTGLDGPNEASGIGPYAITLAHRFTGHSEMEKLKFEWIIIITKVKS